MRGEPLERLVGAGRRVDLQAEPVERAGELRAQATSPISAWLTLCGNAACTQRMASGKPQALDASRGYNDVGIRLVREG